MKIMIVDDEPDVRPLFEQRFRREIRDGNIELIFAYSGEEALQRLAESALVLILSDINMPGMDGLELLRRIRAQHPQLPPAVLMVSAYGDAQNQEQARALGADDFLTKPVNFNRLKTILAQYNVV
ncbi:response regulator [Spirosoma rhododendri]|uniref:Response regulator n=1 Tax=Spirosoma rhododendri TaxID=2728024 RepID=A0A7L5DG27_9BACT|nr:response regulator [Spirosoma rhododendri]QJD77166.1 response regulator [Spirosoma rhododendri]